MAEEYLFYFMAFCIFNLMSMSLSVFVRNDGSPTLSFVAMCTGAVANIVLDWLFILRWNPARKLGGVIHCFYGSEEIAERYLKLGYHIGIGGSVLQPESLLKCNLQKLQRKLPFGSFSL